MSTVFIERLRAAAVDGRAQNVFFRQTQLERLCNGLLAEEEALRRAMITDSKYTESEAISVLHAAVQTVKGHYAALHPQRALEEEYRIAHGKDASDNEAPFGLVYLEPEAHTLLYSVCAPLAAAIAAGNCVALLLENTLRELPALIKRVLTDALEAETFAVLSSPLTDNEIFEESIVVRRSNDGETPRINEILARSNAATVAVVDRTADIDRAAHELRQATLAFGGRSPYSPDVIMVNEFILDAFLQSLLDGGSSGAPKGQKPRLPENNSAESLLKCNLHEGSVSSAPSSTSLASVIREKATKQSIFIQPIRSLDDAINLLEEHRNRSYLAAFHFGDLRSAKYLSQFVDADVTFVNQIPQRLLIGPVAPQGHNFDLQHRYQISMFSRRRPVFVQPSPTNKLLMAALASEDNKTAQQLLQQAREPLKAMKRSEGGGVGFFEQGILLGLSFIAVSVVTVSAAGAWQLWKYRSSR